MKTYPDFPKLRKKILSKENYCAGFDCTNEDDLFLNEFYHCEALDYQSERSGITYCFMDGTETLGFVTLSMADILATDLDPDQRLGLNHDNFPALHIGRLATDNNIRGQYLGFDIIRWCVGLAMELSRYLGCRYLVLQTDAKHHTYYTQNECRFTLFHEKNGEYWLARKLEALDYIFMDDDPKYIIEFIKSVSE